MSTVKAYYVTAEVSGNKKALLTVNWLEMNAFIAETLRETNEVTLQIKQYETTKKQFFIELKELHKGTWEENGTDKRRMEVTDERR